MEKPDTLGGWGHPQKAAYFRDNAEIIIPKRKEQLRFIVDLLPWPPGEKIRVLDLGCGYGAVAREILSRFPQAALMCIDGSPEMVKLAAEPLAEFGPRAEIRLMDMADPDWRADLDGPFDAIVSALAIHHLVDDRKRRLYREIFECWRPAGSS
jgi:tRNA (cmo5U34)-methyltransferase